MNRALKSAVNTVLDVAIVKNEYKIPSKGILSPIYFHHRGPLYISDCFLCILYSKKRWTERPIFHITEAVLVHLPKIPFFSSLRERT